MDHRWCYLETIIITHTPYHTHTHPITHTLPYTHIKMTREAYFFQGSGVCYVPGDGSPSTGASIYNIYPHFLVKVKVEVKLKLKVKVKVKVNVINNSENNSEVLLKKEKMRTQYVHKNGL